MKVFPQWKTCLECAADSGALDAKVGSQERKAASLPPHSKWGTFPTTLVEKFHSMPREVYTRMRRLPGELYVAFKRGGHVSRKFFWKRNRGTNSHLGLFPHEFE